VTAVPIRWFRERHPAGRRARRPASWGDVRTIEIETADAADLARRCNGAKERRPPYTSRPAAGTLGLPFDATISRDREPASESRDRRGFIRSLIWILGTAAAARDPSASDGWS